MELILVRHAEPVRVAGGRQRADPGLTERGREQARRLAEWLAAEEVAALRTSPLRRARETAEPVARVTGRPVRPDEDLAEYDRDAPDYIPVEELRETDDPRWQAMVEGRWDALATVDLPTFRARVRDAMERCIADHPGERVAVICHGGVINVYVAGILGIERPLFFDPAYTSLTRVAASRSGVRSLVTLNETPHLRDLKRPR